MHAEPSQRGYTLIEVLVAFAILAMTLAVLYRIFAAGLLNIGVSSEYLQAVLIAERQLEAAGAGESLQPGRREGIALGKYSWTQTIAAAAPAALVPGQQTRFAVFRVNVRVQWPGGRDMREIDLETLRIAAVEADTGRLR